jgi:hypothetical protein
MLRIMSRSGLAASGLIFRKCISGICMELWHKREIMIHSSHEGRAFALYCHEQETNER